MLDRFLRSYQDSEVIFEEGSSGSEMYLIHSGSVVLSAKQDDGEPITLATLQPGDFFGEMALVDNSPRSASAMAAEETQLIVLDRTRFLFTVRQQPHFALSIMHVLCQRLRELDRRLSSKGVIE
jgi:CRP/FNR family transcriptional regulator